MHLLIPFASALSEAARHVLGDLPLATLPRLLARMEGRAPEGGDEYSFSPPHEAALARAWGWHGGDGALPFAARAAQADGVAVGDLAWGLITPAHWQLGRDHVTLADPDLLALGEDESRALFEAVRGLFESLGFRLAWGAPTRWYGAHESLDGLPTASLDRVIGRRLDLWVRNGSAAPAQARLVRQLQSEVQLLLYPHPINEAREARGALTVNSFWLSGCGRWQPVDAAAVTVDLRLRTPLLADDWAGWAEAWRALDSGPVAALLERAERGESVALTLCGERCAQRFESAARSWWQQVRGRWRHVEPRAVLEAL
jgi:hypothetical protein